MDKKLRSKNTVITAALPYADGDIHLGHIASTNLPPDILYRYLKHEGAGVVQLCASDDFGTPILISAERAGKKPAEYVEYWNKRFQEDLRALGIEYDLFYRTSSEENIKLVQSFFLELQKNGYIFSSDVDQFFCEFDRKFLPDRYVKGKCPYCGAEDQYSDGCENCGRALQPGQIVNPHCSICGRKPKVTKSAHYFFKLSAFSEQLKKWLTSNRNLQPEPRNYVLSWIKEGLQDWDITRDIPWGVEIPLPQAKGKVLYGWFDNHLCYIATALRQAGKTGADGEKYWNESTIYHFIGKDIVYHHYLFLPSMRMGDGRFKLPDFIPTRGYLLLQARKISKSRHWLVTVREFLQDFPPDYLRFYLTRVTPFDQSDTNFDLDEFQAKVNNELLANVGNFVYRTLVFVNKQHGSIVPGPGEKGKDEVELLRSRDEAVSKAAAFIREGNYDRALKAVLDYSTKCNQYFQKKSPWEKEADEPTALYYSVNQVASLAVLLDPFIPFTSRRIWRQLAREDNVGTIAWDDAGKLLIQAGEKLVAPEPLFKRVEDEKIGEVKARLEKGAAG